MRPNRHVCRPRLERRQVADRIVRRWTHREVEVDLLISQPQGGPHMRRLGSLFSLLAALVALPASLYAQGGGTVSGRVTGADTGQPIASATVSVQGTSLRGVTDSQGRYSISGVPAGTYPLSASPLGREAASRQVTVTAGSTTTADF